MQRVYLNSCSLSSIRLHISVLFFAFSYVIVWEGMQLLRYSEYSLFWFLRSERSLVRPSYIRRVLFIARRTLDQKERAWFEMLYSVLIGRRPISKGLYHLFFVDNEYLAGILLHKLSLVGLIPPVVLPIDCAFHATEIIDGNNSSNPDLLLEQLDDFELQKDRSKAFKTLMKFIF